MQNGPGSTSVVRPSRVILAHGSGCQLHLKPLTGVLITPPVSPYHDQKELYTPPAGIVKSRKGSPPPALRHNKTCEGVAI